MQSDITKACADYLRLSLYTDKEIGSSHAHELVAAFFAYSSKAALLADTTFPIERLEKSKVLIPDVERMSQRMEELKGLNLPLPDAETMAIQLTHYLEDEDYFWGDAWIAESFENYFLNKFLADYTLVIQSELTTILPGAIDAVDLMQYDDFQQAFEGDYFVVKIIVDLSHPSISNTLLRGEDLKVCIEIKFKRVAGKAAFMSPELSVAQFSPDLLEA